MSAIVGAVVFCASEFRITTPYISSMRDTMVHRGPDGAENWISEDERVGFGHRRLAVADPSQLAIQPIASHDDRYRIVFNGQIYNHLEVKAELDQAGSKSWSPEPSQAEIILEAFVEWGIECLQRFNGCFAIAIWDTVARELWLVRDRVGIKPLYYSIHNNRITFASEIKALLEDPDQKRAVNEDALFHYMSFLATPAPLTMFDGINKMPCATWMRVLEDGQTESRRYWDPLDAKESLADLSDDDICDRIHNELRLAVTLRTPHNGQVGAYLSGGLDSAINTALMADAVEGRLKTFTYSYEFKDENYREEVGVAKSIADHLGYENYTEFMTIEKVLESLPVIAKLHDEPVSDPHNIAFFHTSRLARDHGILACHNTIGADELFLGIPRWHTWLKLARMNAWPVPRVLKKLGLLGLKLAGRKRTFAYERLRRVANGEQLFWNGVEMFPDAGKKYLLSEKLRKKFKQTTSFECIKPIRETFEQRRDPKAYLTWATYVDLHIHTPEHQLMRSEKASMGSSHETRFPFLDHNLIELAMTIPAEVHMRTGRLKPILEKIGREITPYNLIERSQSNSGFPYQWLFGKVGDVARQKLDDLCQATDFFDRDRVLQYVDDMQYSQDFHAARQVWCLLVFATWWEQYIRAEKTH